MFIVIFEALTVSELLKSALVAACLGCFTYSESETIDLYSVLKKSGEKNKEVI